MTLHYEWVLPLDGMDRPSAHTKALLPSFAREEAFPKIGWRMDEGGGKRKKKEEGKGGLHQQHLLGVGREYLGI